MPDDKDPKSEQRETAKAASALAFGFLFPLSIVAGFVIGHYLDKLFGTGWICTVIFSILGVAGAFVQLFRFSRSSDGR